MGDDQRVDPRLVQIFLSKLDGESSFANNGAEAVRQVQAGSIDLVLMDHQMPAMDGIAPTKAVRLWGQAQQRAGRLPILALTAHASAGGKAFVSPPARTDISRSRSCAPPWRARWPPRWPPVPPPCQSLPLRPDRVSPRLPADGPGPRRGRANQDHALLDLLAAAFTTQSEELLTVSD